MTIKYKVEISHEEGNEEDGRWSLDEIFDTPEEAEDAALQDGPWVGTVYPIDVEEIESPDLTAWASNNKIMQAPGETCECYKKRVRDAIDADFKDHCEKGIV